MNILGHPVGHRECDHPSDDEDYSGQAQPFLSTPENGKNIKSRQHRRCHTPQLLFVIIGWVMLGSLATFIIFLYSNNLPPHRLPISMIQPCGKTSKEARARGCHFDVISFCWLPTECYDSQLSEEYDANMRLEWFLDANHTQPVTHQQVMTGEFSGLYVNWEYHLSHCTAMWRKMHRAILGRSGIRAIDSYIGSYEHTKHCEHMLLNNQSIDFSTINTRIRVKYPDCGMNYSSLLLQDLPV